MYSKSALSGNPCPRPYWVSPPSYSKLHRQQQEHCSEFYDSCRCRITSRGQFCYWWWESAFQLIGLYPCSWGSWCHACWWGWAPTLFRSSGGKTSTWISWCPLIVILVWFISIFQKTRYSNLWQRTKPTFTKKEWVGGESSSNLWLINRYLKCCW